MSIPNLHAWLDEDGRHIWFAHRCKDELSIEMVPFPKWRQVGVGVEPSFHCTACGTHEFGRLDNESPAWLRHHPHVQAAVAHGRGYPFNVLPPDLQALGRVCDRALATQPEQGAEGEAVCWCHACHDPHALLTRMILCPDCGNKRCPRASDHRLVCTGSNEAGQPGSVYKKWEPAPTAQEGEK